jgi:hypothetical protein
MGRPFGVLSQPVVPSLRDSGRSTFAPRHCRAGLSHAAAARLAVECQVPLLCAEFLLRHILLTSHRYFVLAA